MKTDFDLIVVGGGIVGLAVALKMLQWRPSIRLLLLEKEQHVAAHQTGHNSGVIHSGLYYKPGSLKAKNCIEGYQQLIDFCDKESIPYEICGKLVVATSEEELSRLNDLHQRGVANGLKGINLLGPQQIREIEPNCAGIKGLYVPQTGIVNYREVAAKYAEKIVHLGGNIQCGQLVSEIKRSNNIISVATQDKCYTAKQLVTCAGLQSDRMAMHTNPNLDLRITPFRGEYYKLKPSAEKLIRNLIYPVPDPSFPFLGVHFTRMMAGGVECGPNAVLAFSREGYKKSDINLTDMLETLTWPGFQKVAIKYWRSGVGEFYRSFSKAAFVRALQRLVPAIQSDDLEPGGAGVRAQACARDGGLIDDFYIQSDSNVIHVCNAPSPAATASLSIGASIAEQCISHFDQPIIIKQTALNY